MIPRRRISTATSKAASKGKWQSKARTADRAHSTVQTAFPSLQNVEKQYEEKYFFFSSVGAEDVRGPPSGLTATI